MQESRSEEYLVQEGVQELPLPKKLMGLEIPRDLAALGYDFPEEEEEEDMRTRADKLDLEEAEAQQQQRRAAEQSSAAVDAADQVPEIKRVTYWQKQFRIPDREQQDQVEDVAPESLKTTSVVAEEALVLTDATSSAAVSSKLLLPRSLGSATDERKMLELEMDDIRKKNKLLEAAMTAQAMDMEAMKQEFQERENDLLDKLECLELANEQLLSGGENSGMMEQLQMELTRLQKQNTLLAQRERELQFQLSTKDMLQKEVHHLQELNEQLLHTRLVPEEAETEAESSKMLERIVTLETELAEAMEVNNLYRSQLQTAVKTTTTTAGNDHLVDAREELLQQLKLQVKEQASELQEIRDRFYLMSIRLAETEAQHEETLMKMKRLQNTPSVHLPRKSFSISSSFKLLEKNQKT
ncbi:unnamed protein product [Sphagnum troendelagicum]|uniref:Uncharacterized protein n=1 Tax=Sphagnum troendelagicum TaxID=128251 RepID=A0ABP0TU39_9BRYO